MDMEFRAASDHIESLRLRHATPVAGNHIFLARQWFALFICLVTPKCAPYFAW
jgi:hypothetical protein